MLQEAATALKYRMQKFPKLSMISRFSPRLIGILGREGSTGCIGEEDWIGLHWDG